MIHPGRDPVELNGGEDATTNNRMELRAAVEALAALPAPHRVTVHTDSQYLQRGITRWLDGWRARGWRTAGKTEVRNRDLWERLSTEMERHEVEWRWVKGHAGNRWNERADRLAGAGIPRPEVPVDDDGAVHLFVATSVSGKRGRAAWAAALYWEDRQKILAGSVNDVAPNRLHVLSAVEGLRALRRPVRVHVYTVSDYLRDGVLSWLGAWKRRGWKTRDGRPVAHRDLWRKLDRLAARHETHWHVVKRDGMPRQMEAAKERAREELREAG